MCFCVEDKMKISRLLVITVFSMSFIFSSGCSYLKSKGSPEGAGSETAGLGEEESFGPEGVSEANKLKAPFNQAYYFAYDNFDVQSEDHESINVQANYLLAHPSAKVRLEGNTDERGSREYNIALGWKRAKAVLAILKAQGVKTSQVAVVSFGKEKPIAFGHDENSYSKNRRVDLIYESK
jgi:peptidoglycan-associated lipoprotein